MAELLTI